MLPMVLGLGLLVFTRGISCGSSTEGTVVSAAESGTSNVEVAGLAPGSNGVAPLFGEYIEGLRIWLAFVLFSKAS